mmetsp:Transcript_21909/g.46218  ORF Transcript_21909/g.46218 Transcript_21909/m.46218 type:complete len:207 (+) Transcript_21909:376-996(+)
MGFQQQRRHQTRAQVFVSVSDRFGKGRGSDQRRHKVHGDQRAPQPGGDRHGSRDPDSPRRSVPEARHRCPLGRGVPLARTRRLRSNPCNGRRLCRGRDLLRLYVQAVGRLRSFPRLAGVPKLLHDRRALEPPVLWDGLPRAGLRDPGPDGPQGLRDDTEGPGFDHPCQQGAFDRGYREEIPRSLWLGASKRGRHCLCPLQGTSDVA